MTPLLKKGMIAVFFGINIFLTIFGFASLYGTPYTGLRLAVCGEAACVKSVDEGSPAYKKINPGDRIIDVGGKAISHLAFHRDPSYLRSRKDLSIFWEAQGKLTELVVIGNPATLLVERAGSRVGVSLTPVAFPLYRAFARTTPLYLVGWTFIVVAYLVLRKNDHEIAVVNYFIGSLVCASFVCLASFAFRDMALPLVSFQTLIFIGQTGSRGFSCAAVYLMLIFPRRKKALLDHPWLIMVPPALFIAVSILHLTRFFDSTYLTTYIFKNICLVLFFGKLLHDFLTEKNLLYKRQIQWVVFGMMAGITAWLGMTSLPIVFNAPFVSEELSVLPTVLYPLSFAFAVMKYRLMDIETIFDTAVVYGGTIIILEAIELAVLGTMSKYISAAHRTPYLTLVGVLIIVFLYVPLRNKVRVLVNRLFKRGKYDIAGEGSASMAKITPPKTTSGIVPRKRLFSRLDAKGAHSVIWVTGPAGSGKTTLASSWLESRGHPSLWYTIDEGDGDIAGFFHYLGLAATRLDAARRKPLPSFTPEYAGGMTIFTRRWFDDMYGRLVPHASRLTPDKVIRRQSSHGFIIVFDNYHDAPLGSAFHEMIVHGLEVVPEGIKVIILSRSEPPSSFSRMIANSRLHILGWEDIRLTPEESRALVCLKSDKAREELSDRLHEMTGGWAAGIVLTLERSKFMGSDLRSPGNLAPEETFAYFSDEIFDKIDAATRNFLLKTSFLPEMTADSAEKLTGDAASRQRLDHLSKNHYFTERYPGDRTEYRYHPLFRRFLLAKADAGFSTEELSQMRRRIALLLGESGKIEDAVESLMKAADWSGAAEMISRHARMLLKQGRTRTLSRWFAAFPDDIIKKSPWLMYWSGFCSHPAGYMESRTRFEKAFHGFEETNDPAGMLLSCASIMDTIVYEFGDLHRFDKWIDRLNDHLSKHPDFPSAEMEFKVASSMMVALMFTRYKYDEIAPWVEKALGLLPSCPDINLRISTGAYAALFYVWTGELNKAGTIVNDQRRWCGSPDATPLNLIIGRYTEALYQWISAYPDFGAGAAEDGLKLSSDHGIHMLDHHLHARMLFGALNSGDLDAARSCHDRLQAATEGSGMMQMVRFQYHYLAPWHSLLREDYSAALQQARDSLKVCDEAGGSAFHRAFSNLMVAHAFIEFKEYSGADERLSEVCRIADGIKSPIIGFTCLLSESYLLFRKASGPSGGESLSTRALEVLRRAMALGRERGYMNTIAWIPQVVTHLCARALDAGIEVEYVRQLIRQRRLTHPVAIKETDPKSEIQNLKLENWPWPVKIHTLGRFALFRDEVHVQTEQKASRKPIELLKATVSFGEAGADKAQLIEALWPEAEGDAGNHAFETALYRLRKLLDHGEAITLRNNRLTLDPRFCWSDAWAFEKFAQNAEHELRNADLGLTIGKQKTRDSKSTIRNSKSAIQNLYESAIEKALDLYKGQFLPGEEGAWAVSYRERLRDRFLRAVSGLGRRWEQQGKWKKAVECYRRGLEADYLAEEFYQGLMTAYDRMGCKAEAVKTYQRCRDILKSSLGMEPSPRTEAIHQAIRENR